MTLPNIVGVNVGWWACVLGAARGNEWIGPAVVIGHLAVHLGLSRNRTDIGRFLTVAAVVGFCIDSFLGYKGALIHLSGWLSPIWMVALWPNFATSLTTSLVFLKERLILASALGTMAGPVAYAGGAALGALRVTSGGWLWVAVAWTIAMPLLVYLSPVVQPAEDDLA